VTKQQGRFGLRLGLRSGIVVGRMALGLVVLATGWGLCTALLAPIATASPESEANDSITTAWKHAGGDKSDLGAPQGDVYPVGEGFAQDFSHGKMFFTPATGARAISGAVLDKYEALGGPVDSDLGFPTIDEVPGLAGPDSRVSTFSASDKPVIFWTPDHGAFVVRGPINVAWDKLGSSGGILGVPVSDETYDGHVVTQAFSAGRVSWNGLTKVFDTAPPELAQQLTAVQVPDDPTAAINMAWRAAGGVSGPLGAGQGGQYPVGGDGLAQNFAGGKIFYSPATGANAVETDILAKYESLGGPVGSGLGFPTANEADGGIEPASRISTFSAADKAVIFWTPDHGAVVVRGVMKTAWDKLGGPTGALGVPVGDQTVDKDVVAQKFTGGQIAWDQVKNTFSSEPVNLASSLSGLRGPGHKVSADPASASTSVGGVDRVLDGVGRAFGGVSRALDGMSRALGWHWWWLLGGVPAMLLIAITALALKWRRRRASARRDDESCEPDPDVDIDYDAVTDSVRQWSKDTDSDLASASLSDSYSDYSDGQQQASLPPETETIRLPGQPGNGWMRPARSTLVGESPMHGITSAAKLSSLSVNGKNNGETSENLGEDPDSADTAPTRILTQSEVSSGVSSGQPQARVGSARVGSGRHAAVDTADDDAEFVALQLRTPGELAIHLPLDDPYQVPEGYPVKANASFGLYYMPDNDLYEETLAEIWFSSEEFARANGFIKAG
jgi:uncharacterized protein with LGFP repeats